MVEIRQTKVFAEWFDGLGDARARARIAIRIRRLSQGNQGDVRSVGGGVFEIRIHYGPGYRVYFIQRGEVYVLLLCGGTKHGQERDIARAVELARDA